MSRAPAARLPLPTGATSRFALAIATVTATAFAIVLWAVDRVAVLSRVDRRVAFRMLREQQPRPAGIARMITHAGEQPVLVAVVVVAGIGASLLVRSWRPALLMALGYGAAASSVFVLKHLVARPSVGAGQPALSFPSGHTTTGVAVWGMVALVAWPALRATKLRFVVTGVAVALAAAVGPAMVYLDAHWLSDVVGGYLLGLACLALAVAVVGVPARLARTKRVPAS